MSKDRKNTDKKSKLRTPDHKDSAPKSQAERASKDSTGLVNLQQQVGNRAVQRLVAQRSGKGAFTLDDVTASQIERERGGGQALDQGTQKQVGRAMGEDFDDVRIHDSRESDELNRQLGARAFTTGNDIFFREGEYQPGTGQGQELLAHELTHVVQQRDGQVDEDGGSGGMRVNAPDDKFEQQAEKVAGDVTGGGAEVQRAGAEEEDLQMAAVEEEEEELQMAAVEEEEEELQMAAVEEEEEELQMAAVEEEEEELQMAAVEEEEEELQMASVEEEEEGLQMKRKDRN